MAEATSGTATSRTRRPGSYADILHNCAPASLTNAAQLLAVVAVTGMVGHMGGTALYVRSVYLPLSLILIAVTVCFSVPLQVAVARSREGRTTPVQSSRIGTSALLVVASVLTLAAATALLAGPLARLAGMPASLVPDLRTFAVLMVGAQLFGAVGELGAATLRGSGRAVWGTLLSLGLAIVNVGLVAAVGLRLGAESETPQFTNRG